jgi:hypothetical protein
MIKLRRPFYFARISLFLFFVSPFCFPFLATEKFYETICFAFIVDCFVEHSHFRRQCTGDVFAAPHRQRVGELLNKNARRISTGDGNADVAVADHYSNKIFVIRGDGAGNLGAATAYETGSESVRSGKSDLTAMGALI